MRPMRKRNMALIKDINENVRLGGNRSEERYKMVER